MIDFERSLFTWKHRPWTHDPHYRWAGGFVGEEGQSYHVRFRLEAACEILDPATGEVTRLYAGAPCRTEYTIARRNLFQIPSSEWRLVFGDEDRVDIARRPQLGARAGGAQPPCRSPSPRPAWTCAGTTRTGRWPTAARSRRRRWPAT